MIPLTRAERCAIAAPDAALLLRHGSVSLPGGAARAMAYVWAYDGPRCRRGAILLPQARRDRRGSRHRLSLRKPGRLAGCDKRRPPAVTDDLAGRSGRAAVPAPARRRRGQAHFRLRTRHRAGTRQHQHVTISDWRQAGNTLLHPATSTTSTHRYTGALLRSTSLFNGPSAHVRAYACLPLPVCRAGGACLGGRACLRAPLTYDDARHLLNRAGFGATASEIERYVGLTPRAGRPQGCSRARERPRLRPRRRGPPKAGALRYPRRGADASDMERKLFQQEQVREGLELRGWWLAEMLATPSPLTERMTLFWHNHFVSSQQKVKLSRADVPAERHAARQRARQLRRSAARGRARSRRW